MKRSKISVPWEEGLHLRCAANIVNNATHFQSSIRLKANKRIANARSIFSILLLCATMGTVVEVEAAGPDEEQAMASIISLFDSDAGEIPAATDSDEGETRP